MQGLELQQLKHVSLGTYAGCSRNGFWLRKRNSQDFLEVLNTLVTDGGLEQLWLCMCLYRCQPRSVLKWTVVAYDSDEKVGLGPSALVWWEVRRREHQGTAWGEGELWACQAHLAARLIFHLKTFNLVAQKKCILSCQTPYFVMSDTRYQWLGHGRLWGRHCSVSYSSLLTLPHNLCSSYSGWL